MNATVRSSVTGLMLAAGIAALAGCAGQEPTYAPAVFHQLPDGWREHFAYYPSGDVSKSVLMIREAGPAQVQANQDFEYTIEVYNPTDKALLKNVMIRDFMSPGIHVVASTPTWQFIDAREEEGEWIPDFAKAGPDLDDVPVSPPRIETQQRRPDAPRLSQMPEIRWFIEELYPEKLVTIKVKARATSEKDIRNCVTANYEVAACIVSNVVAPELSMKTMLEKEFVICALDQTDIRFMVTNSGTAGVKNVVVHANLPEGLTTVDGGKEISVNIGDVGAKQSKEATQRLRVLRPGSYTVQARAVAANNISADSAQVTITARQGTLGIAAAGPSLEYVGLPTQYDITVNNSGDARIRDVVIEGRIPQGMEFVDASDGGSLQGDLVVWRMPELPAGQTQRMMVHLRGREPGNFRFVGTARGVCAAEVSEIVNTKLEGVPALLLEVVDTQDPNRVGQEEVYEIQVTNQGSAPENNIRVKCGIEDAERFISATGATPTKAKAGAKTVEFEPLASLAPKETAVWRVAVRCVAPADVRFSAEVTSDELTRPVHETEATSIYAASAAR